ncbi:trimeric intracellular cation channel family protein [Ferrimonas balearica]|uniref:trimeric intracellular cation channel family protein n=1 Tax=Ferrimonas balearica TaxID=44012 RepID=UPI001C99BD29|nr:trimeric intracellular cation channel family protein [Ferrimonas balearica]MBY5993153.1 trimeric intracellular cation channel family protein [Ferrimonas balearica]
MDEAQFITALWVVGILAEAMTGALAAGRRQMDLFGVVIVGCVTAIGGGTVRDLLIGNYPLVWIAHVEYLLAIAVAALLTVAIAPVMRYLSRLFLVIDALGLAVFSVIGAQKTLALGLNPLVAVVMGVVTGVFGGVIRDIFCQSLPLVFHRELYAAVALFTAGLYVLLDHLKVATDLSLLLCLGLGFLFRLLAIRRRWTLPRFHYQESAH